MRARAFVAVWLALSACSPEEPQEIMGIGEYLVTKTTLGQSGGKCQKDGKFTWCFLLETVKLGGQASKVDLYYRGHGDDAPLIEMLVSVRSCDRAKVGRALFDLLKTPTETLANGKLIWAGKKVHIIADVPAKGSECELSFLAATESKRIAQLRGDAVPAKKAPSTNPAKKKAPGNSKTPKASPAVPGKHSKDSP